jgi:hypothetical protein
MRSGPLNHAELMEALAARGYTVDFNAEVCTLTVAHPDLSQPIEYLYFDEYRKSEPQDFSAALWWIELHHRVARRDAQRAMESRS